MTKSCPCVSSRKTEMGTEETPFTFRNDPLLEMFRAGELTPQQFLLAEVIRSFDPATGCFATNAYLGRAIGSCQISVARALAVLAEKGLVRITRNGNKRHVEGLAPALRRVSAGANQKYSSTKNTRETKSVARTAATPPVRDDRVLSFNSSDGKAMYPTLTTPVPQGNDLPLLTEHMNMAVSLRDGLVAKMVTLKKVSMKNWARVFARLCQRYDPVRVKKVLDWYTPRIRSPYTPLAFSARGFDEKFERIEQAMLRGLKKTEEVTISPAAARIAKYLTNMLIWPKGSESQVPAVVQKSLDAAEDLKRRLLAREDRGGRGQAKTAAHVAGWTARTQLLYPSDFVQTWMQQLHYRLCNWQEWSGKLMPFAFRPDDDRFRNDGRGWAKEYCGNPDVWDQLMEEIFNEG